MKMKSEEQQGTHARPHTERTHAPDKHDLANQAPTRIEHKETAGNAQQQKQEGMTDLPSTSPATAPDAAAEPAKGPPQTAGEQAADQPVLSPESAPFFYCVTAQPATTVEFSVVGHFTAPTDTNLIVDKGTQLELYSLAPEGLVAIATIPVYATITAMEIFRPTVCPCAARTKPIAPHKAQKQTSNATQHRASAKTCCSL